MEYVHGYSDRESERLQDQSRILEDLLHAGTSYGPGRQVLEAGCGVGAQTVILAANSSGARITSIDISEESLAKAEAAAAGRGINNVTFRQADIYQLPFEDSGFDDIFVCFVLEHLDDPVAALLELKRVLREGGTLTAIEGDHGSCFWHPETKESLAVWNCLIEVQSRLGHDGLIGRRLYPLLDEAGFRIQDVSPRLVYGDGSKPKLLDGMVNRIIVPMTQTARKESLELGLVDETTWEKGISDLERSGYPPEGTFFYTWFKGLAFK